MNENDKGKHNKHDDDNNNNNKRHAKADTFNVKGSEKLRIKQRKYEKKTKETKEKNSRKSERVKNQTRTECKWVE